MKRSLLEIVRDILNDMDSDDVNFITDTVEAGQVAQIVKSCYFEMISNRNWPHLKHLAQLEHSGDPSKPTHLKLPENIKELLSFNYQKSKVDGIIEYQPVIYKHPDDFLRLVSSKNANTVNVETVKDSSGVDLIVINNKAPSYWTSFDDNYLVCDSYNRDIEDTLQKRKTQAIYYRMPKWVHLGDAIPDLPSEAFSALIEEAKSTAFLTLKQMGNEKAEQKASRQQRWLSRKAWQASGGIQYSDFGRRSKK